MLMVVASMVVNGAWKRRSWKTIYLSLVSLQVRFNWYEIFHRLGVSMVQPGNVFYSLEKLLFFRPLKEDFKGTIIDLTHNFVVNLEGMK